MQTYSDLIEQLRDFVGGNVNADTVRKSRRAVQMAWEMFHSEHAWRYYWQIGQINLAGHQTSSTVAYDHSGGVNERQVTLASGTWPASAARGYLLIANQVYKVDRRISDTVLTLDETLNPGADLSSGTAYTYYEDTYLLPENFAKLDSVMLANSYPLRELRPNQIAERKSLYQTSGRPELYAIVGDSQRSGRMALQFYPAPTEAEILTYTYRRRPKPLVTEEYSTGTVSCTVGSTTITGEGTTWTSALHNGAVLRLSSSASTAPTSLAGSNPRAVELVVQAVVSNTSIITEAPAPQALSGVKYTLSDQVDVEPGTMFNAFVRLCQLQLSIELKAQDLERVERYYERELLKAMEADSRSVSIKTLGRTWVPGIFDTGRTDSTEPS